MTGELIGVNSFLNTTKYSRSVGLEILDENDQLQSVLNRNVNEPQPIRGVHTYLVKIRTRLLSGLRFVSPFSRINAYIIIWPHKFK